MDSIFCFVPARGVIASMYAMSASERQPTRAGGLATFCVLTPTARNTDAFDEVHPCGLTVSLPPSRRPTQFSFTGVLSTVFDLFHFLVDPLIRHALNDAGALVVCTPPQKSREGHNTLLNLLIPVLPALFAAAADGACAEIGVQVIEVRHGSIIDALNIRRVATVADAEWTTVVKAGARAAWDVVLEKLSERYSRGLSSSEDSALIVRMKLPSGGILTVCDAGAAPTHLGHLTLILNSGLSVPQEQRTIAPRIGLTFALQDVLPPKGLVHVVVLPDPVQDPTYSLRVMRFATQLHSDAVPLTEGDLFPSSATGPPLPRPLGEGARGVAQIPNSRPPEDWQRDLTEYPMSASDAASSLPTDISTIRGSASRHPRQSPTPRFSLRDDGVAETAPVNEVSSPSSSDDTDNAADAMNASMNTTKTRSNAPPMNGHKSSARETGSDRALADAYLGRPPKTPPKHVREEGGRNASSITQSALNNSGRTSTAQRLSDRLTECEEQLQHSRRTSAAFESELERCRKANTELAQALDDANREAAELRGVAATAQQEGREMSDLLRKLSVRLTELQDASQSHRDESIGLRSVAEEATAEAARLRRELHDTKKALRQLEAREKDRVRNAALARAAGHALAEGTDAAAITEVTAKDAKRGSKPHSTPHTPLAHDGTTRRRLQELVTQNAKLNMKIDELTLELGRYKQRSESAASRDAPSHVSRYRPTAGYDSVSGDELDALRREVEILRAQVATQTAEIEHLSEERASLQRTVVAHPRSNSASDVLMSVSQSCLRGLELMLSKMRAEVASAAASNSNVDEVRQLQQQRASQIHAVEKLKASIVAVSQKGARHHIPACATSQDVDGMAQAMKSEIERLAHVKALLPTYAQLCIQCGSRGTTEHPEG